MNMEEILQQLPSSLGAEIITSGRLFHPYKIARIKFGNWPIFINMSFATGSAGSIYTAIDAFFVAKDQLRLSLTHKNFLSGINKHVLTGDDDFDRNFALSGSDEQKIKSIFSNGRIRQLMKENPTFSDQSFSFQLLKDGGITEPGIPQNISRLMFYRSYALRFDEKIETFRDVCEILKESLGELVKVGSASEEDPKMDNPSPFIL